MRQRFVQPAETGRRVRSLRLGRRLTQRQLASKAGVGVRTVINLENGTGVSVPTLGAVAAVLGASADDLLAPRRKDRSMSEAADKVHLARESVQ